MTRLNVFHTFPWFLVMDHPSHILNQGRSSLNHLHPICSPPKTQSNLRALHNKLPNFALFRRVFISGVWSWEATAVTSVSVIKPYDCHAGGPFVGRGGCIFMIFSGFRVFLVSFQMREAQKFPQICFVLVGRWIHFSVPESLILRWSHRRIVKTDSGSNISWNWRPASAAPEKHWVVEKTAFLFQRHGRG